ncbi:uncharacterized protein LOC107798356 [Nicotiana tabacum]|uniref:Uncharacterized protein LOC107798356 n=1 Tax=Nicotiana tabacum TaxID=4097 RepID=A0AC58SSN9_TOBAC
MEDSGNLDEEMLQLQDVEVEVRLDDEFAQRPHRTLDFNKVDSSQSIQDKIAKFNHLSPRGVQDDHVVNILEDTEQQVTVSISHHMGSTPFHLTAMYAKCKAYLRQQLWTKFREIADIIQGSWGVVGDFNVITNSIKKKGGYYGAMYTWSDNRGAPKTIWKRLDRLLINMEWLDEFSKTTVEHLARAFGDIYEEPKRLEKQINELEAMHVADTTPAHRVELNEAKAKYILYLKIQEEVLRQETKAQWLNEGDKNTSYFHSVIKERRKILCIQKIQDDEGQWREGDKKIAEAAISHFHKIFNHGEASNDFSALEYVLLQN